MSTKPPNSKSFGNPQGVASSGAPMRSHLNGDSAIWQTLMQQATRLSVAQLDAFSARLSNALFAVSESTHDSRTAHLNFGAAQLLKSNSYSFFYLASAALEVNFRQEIDVLLSKADPVVSFDDAPMSLVSFEEMDKKLALAHASRSFELASAEKLLALNMRLANLLDRESVSVAQNPFRPEVLLKTLQSVWCEFNPEIATHHLILPLLRADIVFDLAPIYQALNETLHAQGILPDLPDSQRFKKKPQTAQAQNSQNNPQSEHTPHTSDSKDESQHNGDSSLNSAAAHPSGGQPQ